MLRKKDGRADVGATRREDLGIGRGDGKAIRRRDATSRRY
jgi:hypothetical protein